MKVMRVVRFVLGIMPGGTGVGTPFEEGGSANHDFVVE